MHGYLVEVLLTAVVWLSRSDDKLIGQTGLSRQHFVVSSHSSHPYCDTDVVKSSDMLDYRT